MKVMPSTQHILCVLLWPTNSIGDTGRNKHGEGRKGRLQRGNLLNPEHSVSSCCQVHRTLALPTCHLMTCHSPQGKVGRGAGEEGKEGRGGGHQNTASCPLGTSLSQGWSRGPSKQVSKSLVSTLLGDQH